LLLSLYGAPDAGPIVTGFLGLLLLSSALGAIGLFASSLTSSQPLAAIGALFAVLALWFAHVGSNALAVGGLAASLSISERLRSFAGGAIDLGDLVFFVTVAGLALVGAAAAVESRRWR
jgi:ABC-2 type transport system permease protein